MGTIWPLICMRRERARAPERRAPSALRGAEAVRAALLCLLAAGCGSSDTTVKDLRSPNVYTRMRAIDRIIEDGDARDEAVPLLAQCMEAPVGPASVRAAEALAGLGERGVPILVRGLQSPNEEVRWKAAKGLTTAGPSARQAASALMLALKDSDAHVRQQAAMALGRSGAREAIPSLRNCLKQETDPQTKDVVAGALKQLGDASPRSAAGPTRVIERRGEVQNSGDMIPNSSPHK